MAGAKTIVLFNHKGGVSKTTTTFHLGWKMVEKGKCVLMADFDPQCNLTGMVMGFAGESDINRLYQNGGTQNIKDGLSPAFESKPIPLEAVKCVKIRPSLFLLPGHIGLADYEATLSIAQELSGSIQALQNIPGSIRAVLDLTAKNINADYILIDTSPSLSPLNCNLLMTSDYFLIPTSPDLYSVMAIESLAKTFPRWRSWAERASELDILKNATYPFPQPHPKFLGTVIQKYRPRVGSAPASQFQKWIKAVQDCVHTKLIPSIKPAKLMLEERKYADGDIGNGYTLASIPDFNSLIAASQKNQKPVFELTNKDTGYTGVVAQSSNKTIEKFDHIFSDFATKIINMTSNE